MKKLIFILFLIIFFRPLLVYSEEVDISIIIQIESSGNPNAYNEQSGCIGLMQISEVCLEHYNQIHRTKYSKQDLYNPETNKKIGQWYVRWISNYLKKKKLYSVDNVLICYNWGIGNFLKYKENKKSLPIETQQYIKKYKDLLDKRNKILYNLNDEGNK